MEVPGRKSESLSVSKSSTKDLFCHPCTNDGDRAEAKGFCVQCGEFLCSACINSHKKFKLMKGHEILSGSSMPQSIPVSEIDDSKTRDICPYHSDKASQEAIKFYCPTHRSLGCGDCIVLYHRRCKVDYIPDICKAFKGSKEYKGLIHFMRSLNESLDEGIHAAEYFSKMNDKQYDNALGDLEKFRTKVNAYLDEQKQDIVKHAKTIAKKNDKVIKNLLDTCVGAKKDLKSLKESVEPKAKSECRLFINAMKAENKTGELEADVVHLGRKLKDKFNHITFVPEKDILYLAKHRTPIGKLCVKQQSHR